VFTPVRGFVAGKPGWRRQALVSWVLFKGALAGSVTRWLLRGETFPTLKNPVARPTGVNFEKLDGYWVVSSNAQWKIGLQMPTQGVGHSSVFDLGG